MTGLAVVFNKHDVTLYLEIEDPSSEATKYMKNLSRFVGQIMLATLEERNFREAGMKEAMKYITLANLDKIRSHFHQQEQQILRDN